MASSQSVVEIAYQGPFSAITSAPACFSQTIRNVASSKLHTTSIDLKDGTLKAQSGSIMSNVKTKDEKYARK